MKFLNRLIGGNVLLKVTSLNSLSVIAQMVCGLIISKVIAVFVGPQGMTLIGNLRNFLGAAQQVSILGMYNGIVKYIQVDLGRFSNHERIIYDINWNQIPVSLAFPKFNGKLEKPSNLQDMIFIASKLSKGINFSRVDMYSFKNKIYIGEITFTPGANVEKFNPAKYDKIFGEPFII